MASFNVENLFGRPKVFNFRDRSIGDEILGKIEVLRGLLEQESYAVDDKEKILALYQELKDYIFIREDRGKFFKKAGWKVVGVKADGVGDWDGTIEFKRAKYSDVARKNTAKVLKGLKADIVCVIEAENRESLISFDAHLMGSRYKYDMLVDANDPRGIDVGLYSNYPIGGIWTHMFDKHKTDDKIIFSRDCLEIELLMPENRTLYMLCNHFKSKGYDDGTATEKRTRQADRVVEILKKYDLTSDWVVVAGDLNDTPESEALSGLINVPHLYDVLALQYPEEPLKRWTYHYNQFEQIDYVLVSEPLRQRFVSAGVERRGIYGLKRLTSSSNGLVPIEEEFDKVTHWTNAASDHGGVWAEFEI
jgi:endonuclease/exonuclease/phosphatase family metal-dependent hydrolase